MRIAVIEVDKKYNLRIVSALRSRNDFSDLKEVPPTEFNASDFDFVCLAAVIERTLVQDIWFPGPLKRKMLCNALLSKLESILPIQAEEVNWGYRSYPSDSKHFRLYAIHKEETDVLFQKLDEAGLRCDAFFPLQLLAEEQKVELSASSLFEYMKLDPTLRNITPAGPLLPSGLVPKRYKITRRFYFSLLTLNLIAAGSILFLKYLDFSQEYSQLRQMQNEKFQQYRLLQKVHGQLSQQKELYAKIIEAKLGTGSVLPVLEDLTKILPTHMWVTTYAQADSTINLTISSSKDDLNLYRLLSQSKTYQLLNLRKTKGTDNSTMFYIKLRSEIR